METKDHIYIAQKLAQSLKLSGIRKGLFVLGNFLPDVNPFSYLSIGMERVLMGHSYSYRKSIFESLDACRNKATVLKWYRAGVTMHYLVDSFTRPHNEEFICSTEEHIQYEHRLHQAFRREMTGKPMDGFDPERGRQASLSHWIEEQHRNYLLESQGEKEDCRYIRSVIWETACFLGQKGREAVACPAFVCVEE